MLRGCSDLTRDSTGCPHPHAHHIPARTTSQRAPHPSARLSLGAFQGLEGAAGEHATRRAPDPDGIRYPVQASTQPRSCTSSRTASSRRSADPSRLHPQHEEPGPGPPPSDARDASPHAAHASFAPCGARPSPPPHFLEVPPPPSSPFRCGDIRLRRRGLRVVRARGAVYRPCVTLRGWLCARCTLSPGRRMAAAWLCRVPDPPWPRASASALRVGFVFLSPTAT